MSTLVRAQGLVVRTVRHGESSLIVTAFTRENGKIGLMAKGARGKAKSGAAAALQLLSESQLVYYYKAARDLQLLKEWSLLTAHDGLRGDLDLLATGSAVVELLSRCVHESDPHPELFDAASLTLQALDDRPVSPLPLLWMFELSLFRSLGFALHFETCCQTTKSIEPPLAGSIGFRLSSGGFLHPEAKSALRDGELSGEAFAVLARLAVSSPAFSAKLHTTAGTQREITGFLARYLETHLPVRGHLRSLDALDWSTHPPAKDTTQRNG